MTLATKITVSRIILTIPGVALLFMTNYIWAAFIFLIADLTDVLDGYIAKKRSEVTVFGGFLDALADKILVLLYIAYLQSVGIYPLWLFMIVLVRELIVAAGRSYLLGQDATVGAARSGKPKGLLQALSILAGLGALAIAHNGVTWIPMSEALLRSAAFWVMLVAAIICIIPPQGAIKLICKEIRKASKAL